MNYIRMIHAKTTRSYQSSERGVALIGFSVTIAFLALLGFVAFGLFKDSIRDNYVASDVAGNVAMMIRHRCGLYTDNTIRGCLEKIQREVRDFGYLRQKSIDVNLSYFDHRKGCSKMGATRSPALGKISSSVGCKDLGVQGRFDSSVIAARLSGVFVVEVYMESRNPFGAGSSRIVKILTV
jgi:hypothetical protein